MKTCPVCKAQVFDDMPVCFGCMHRFDEDEAQAFAPVEAPVSAPSPTAARDPLPASVVPAAAPPAAPEAANGVVARAPVSMPAPAYAAPPAAAAPSLHPIRQALARPFSHGLPRAAPHPCRSPFRSRRRLPRAHMKTPPREAGSRRRRMRPSRSMRGWRAFSWWCVWSPCPSAAKASPEALRFRAAPGRSGRPRSSRRTKGCARIRA